MDNQPKPEFIYTEIFFKVKERERVGTKYLTVSQIKLIKDMVLLS